MYPIYGLCIVMWLYGTMGEDTGRHTDLQITCEQANQNCTARVGCGMALHNFLLGCNKVIHSETNNCTGQCTRALIALFSTEDEMGRSLTACDCQGDLYCISVQSRVNVCAMAVLGAMESLTDPSTVVTCSLARWLCEADAHCQTAFTYYLSHCERLYDGWECTTHCKDSLTILHRQPKAAKINNCVCEDDECAEFQTNIDRLCFPHDSGYTINGRLRGLSTATSLNQRSVHVIGIYLTVYLIRGAFM